MSKTKEKMFESLDHLKGSEAFNDYRNFYDGLDPVLKEKSLHAFVCKNFWDKDKRRALLNAIAAPLE